MLFKVQEACHSGRDLGEDGRTIRGTLSGYERGEREPPICQSYSNMRGLRTCMSTR